MSKVACHMCLCVYIVKNLYRSTSFYFMYKFFMKHAKYLLLSQTFHSAINWTNDLYKILPVPLHIPAYKYPKSSCKYLWISTYAQVQFIPPAMRYNSSYGKVIAFCKFKIYNFCSHRITYVHFEWKLFRKTLS